MTYREQFEEALKCETEEAAQAWIDKEIVRYKEDFGVEAERARETIMSNIGYMAGYYDDGVARKIYRLFKAPHPIFGTPTQKEKLTPENCIRLGMESLNESR